MFIDFADLTGGGRVRNLSGHDKGQAARARYDLDALDAGSAPVEIRVPAEIYAISGSFVQGMFAQSLVTLGSKEAFFAHYKFDADSDVLRQIERGLAASRLAVA